MIVLSDPSAFRNECEQARRSQKRVGLVPTMGALHEGHATLIRRAREAADFVAVTIFVNPTQFGPNEDFSRYPRTLDADVEKCTQAGASLVFAPETSAMYPPGDETRVVPGATAGPFCGEFRPGHFQGVATVVSKLFALTGACTAAFGKKDYQQLRVIQRLVTDLFFPVVVLPVPTVRESDGLAMSSRNRYLSETDRRNALAIPRGLSAAHRAFAAGERRASVLTSLVRNPISAVANSIDYVDIADADTLAIARDDAPVSDRSVIAVAARFSGARLIDNVVLGEDPAPIG
ncbi:MAG: pantoate--beta-alanine ligase [Polyangiaceae bacterium]|nr:pantoate--beta-alanine ligase [Polyangiaceae bacterium]